MKLFVYAAIALVLAACPALADNCERSRSYLLGALGGELKLPPKEYDALLTLRPGWSNRTSYVIAPSGKITHVYSDLSPKKHVQETLDAVKALEK